ncbi:hypothetical protein FORC76_0282 [Vibrio cholerae]|nr:hypothetical protein FORC76_0282 [Vibrio cholerae]
MVISFELVVTEIGLDNEPKVLFEALKRFDPEILPLVIVTELNVTGLFADMVIFPL